MSDADLSDEQQPLPPMRFATRRDVRQSHWFKVEELEDHERAPPRDFHRPGYVSLWVGTVGDTEAFALYVEEPDDSWEIDECREETRPLQDDLGFWVNYDYLATRSTRSPVAIGGLLADLQEVESYRESLAAALRLRGIVAADSLIALYHCDYTGHRALMFGRLQFVGSFPFRPM